VTTTAPVEAEHARLAALRRYGVLDTPREESFDRLVRLTARVLDAPMAAISLVDAERVWFKAEIGLGAAEVPRPLALCNRTVAASAPTYEVPDTHSDPTLSGNPLVAAPTDIRFYAGAALVTPEGLRIGTLCVLDRRPRPPLTSDQIATLIDLAGTIMTELERRRLTTLREAAASRLALINDVLAQAGGAAGFVAAIEAVITRLCQHTGAMSGQLWAQGAMPAARVLAYANGGDMTAERRATFFRRLAEVADGNDAFQLPSVEGPVIEPDVTAERATTAPPRFGHEWGMRAFALHPLLVAGERFALLLAFDAPRQDLAAVAELLAEVGRVIRPMLLRKQTCDRMKLLQAAMDATGDAVVVTDPAGTDSQDYRLVRVNPAFTRMTGYQASEVLGRDLRFLQGPGTDLKEVARLRAALAAGEPARAELLNYRRDGTPFWVEVDFAPFTDERGAVARWVGVLRDITERRATQDALRTLASELRRRTAELTELAGLARLGAWRWRAESNAIEWADETYELFGVTRDGFVPTFDGILGLLHPDDVAQVRMAGRNAIRGGRDILVEFRARLAGGRERTIVWNGKARRGADGRTSDIQGYCQDITERRQAEAMMRHGEKLRALGKLTGGISHEFNNLLTVVQANLELALDPGGSLARARPELEAALRAARDGAALTARLTTFARPAPLKREPADLAALIAPLVGMTARTLGGNYRLVSRADPSLPPVPVDRSRLEGAVLNLILNARDAMPEGGPITVETGRITVAPGARGQLEGLPAGEYAVVAVRDRGFGMSAEVAEHAFEPFFTTKPVGGGTGLGLSMVMGFAQRSGGTTLIETAPGRGTVVRIVLPLA
jgi:PAS domain S-box-containing protein